VPIHSSTGQNPYGMKHYNGRRKTRTSKQILIKHIASNFLFFFL
jgi:uncharacterized protein Veg